MIKKVFLGAFNTKWEKLTDMNARELVATVPLCRSDGAVRDRAVHPPVAVERDVVPSGRSAEASATMTNSLLLLAPTLSLSAFAFILFGVDTLKGGGSRKAAFCLALLGLGVTAALVHPLGLVAPLSYGRGMLVADGLSFFLTCIALATTFLVVLLSEQDQGFDGLSLAVYYGLLLLAAVGLILVSCVERFPDDLPFHRAGGRAGVYPDRLPAPCGEVHAKARSSSS